MITYIRINREDVTIWRLRGGMAPLGGISMTSRRMSAC